MIEGLYQPFQHWGASGTTWILSDTPFNDPDLIHVYADRPAEEQVKRIICFFIRLCDYDKFQIDAERANIVRYIEKYGDSAETNEATYNTIYNKVYDFNYRVYRCQRTRSNPLTSWFRAGWWMEIEPIDWAP